ncbi:MAG: ribonuclease III [Candidatus Latescibacteria bacterium]|nr:ribonuclease III [Candidatus Latescibacterota bacterium]MBT4140093.1 ribonuclease III [Candidatus Latescibacterota bacterium]MBT5831412.1 ribonuclease III [Candidatus Latescibacterota bacterium]
MGNRTRPLEELQIKLQYKFSDTDLLVQALKHRSYVYAADENSITSNERLEFLGDAVLDLIVTEYLFQKFPKKHEGELTQIKSLLVSKVVLAERSNDFGLGEFLLLSKEETQAGGRQRTSIIGDAFEALLGAIYLDGGLDVARNFVERIVLAYCDDILSNNTYLNFKSVLLEHTQSEGQGHPRYLVSAEEGPDHRKMFSVEVLISGTPYGVGQGRSKKEAQQMAAKDALEKLDLH